MIYQQDMDIWEEWMQNEWQRQSHMSRVQERGGKGTENGVKGHYKRLFVLERYWGRGLKNTNAVTGTCWDDSSSIFFAGQFEIIEYRQVERFWVPWKNIYKLLKST